MNPKVNPEWTLGEIQVLKSKYENDISDLLCIFHNLTKLKINNIFLSDMEITSIEDSPNNKKFIYTVELDIKL